MKETQGTLILAHTKRALLSITNDEKNTNELLEDSRRIAFLIFASGVIDMRIRFSWVFKKKTAVTMSIWYRLASRQSIRRDLYPVPMGTQWIWQPVTP